MSLASELVIANTFHPLRWPYPRHQRLPEVLSRPISLVARACLEKHLEDTSGMLSMAQTSEKDQVLSRLGMIRGTIYAIFRDFCSGNNL